MKVGVIGSGNVGRGQAGGFASHGYDVMMGSMVGLRRGAFHHAFKLLTR